MTWQEIETLPALHVGTGWIDVEVIGEPTVKITFRGYAPIMPVRVSQTGLDYILYISSKSIGEELQPLRERNGEFRRLKFRIRKESEDKFAKYLVEG